MTRDEAKKLLPVIQAFADGKQVQARLNCNASWVDRKDPGFDSAYEYRIKPEPLECWVTVDCNGDLYAFKEASGAECEYENGLYSPYTIHHMREVIE